MLLSANGGNNIPSQTATAAFLPDPTLKALTTATCSPRAAQSSITSRRFPGPGIFQSDSVCFESSKIIDFIALSTYDPATTSLGLRNSLAVTPRVAEYSNPGLEDGFPSGKSADSTIAQVDMRAVLAL